MAKRLLRDPRQGVFGGVAAGFGQYLDVDPVLVRVAFLLLTFANGIGVLAYLVCWLVIPRGEALVSATGPVESGLDAVREAGVRLATEARTAAANVGSAAPGTAQAHAVMGSLLIAGGALLLAHNLGWLDWPHWLRFRTLWPLLLVALGIGLVSKSRTTTAT